MSGEQTIYEATITGSTGRKLSLIHILWPVTLGKLGGIFGIYCLLPAFIVSSILIIVVSSVSYTHLDVYKRQVPERR